MLLRRNNALQRSSAHGEKEEEKRKRTSTNGDRSNTPPLLLLHPASLAARDVGPSGHTCMLARNRLPFPSFSRSNSEDTLRCFHLLALTGMTGSLACPLAGAFLQNRFLPLTYRGRGRGCVDAHRVTELRRWRASHEISSSLHAASHRRLPRGREIASRRVRPVRGRISLTRWESGAHAALPGAARAFTVTTHIVHICIAHLVLPMRGCLTSILILVKSASGAPAFCLLLSTAPLTWTAA